jgi:hypothetical protein
MPCLKAVMPMIVSSFRAIPFAFLVLVSIPASSQTLEQLDALSDETADEQTGIALARQQAGRGAWLEALATIERVLTRFPGSAEARFDHAMLLCKVGDPQGGLIEFGRLKDKDYPPAALKQAIASCQNVGVGRPS